MFDCTEDWCKIWRQTDLYFLKWHEEFGKFSPEHVRKSKNWVFSWVHLSKVENSELEIYRGVMCHENEEWCKIWRAITCQFEIDLSNLMDFESSTQKSQFEL